MKKFLIVANLNKDTNAGVANKVRDAIVKNNAKAELISFDIFDNKDAKLILKSAEGMEAIIVVGGDGTLIRTARATNKLNLPVIGVNTGHIGYLCEIDEERIDAAVLSLINDDFSIEDRMMLKGEFEDGISRLSLNDVVIYRSGELRTISTDVFVDDQLLTTIKGDGVVVSTPTGSTGYSMSCGGPIIDPSSRMIVLTPCASHSLRSRSIVLKPESKIEIMVKDHAGFTYDGDIHVSFDGEESMKIAEGTKLKIVVATEKVRLIRLKKTGFLELLYTKLAD
ncbi:MAG: NAD(+)/NADH kinase [Lachnospiraceae bacterium]|jgi:NAD+ kinase|nr:NAD(+)/NADH kinase [Lachnospiraceae bacterium]